MKHLTLTGRCRATSWVALPVALLLAVTVTGARAGDDAGDDAWNAPGVYENLKWMATPNTDRLATGGVRFTAAEARTIVSIGCLTIIPLCGGAVHETA